MDGKCGTCRYWEALDEHEGYCYRHAPVIVAGMLDPHEFPESEQSEAVWPITARRDGCGDWVER